MARTNKGADGKPLTYAEQNRERILNGEEARKPEEMDELDQLDVQQKILEPDEIKIALTDGKKLCVCKALSPAAVKKRHVVDCLQTLTELLVLETSKLSGDAQADTMNWFSRNEIYLKMAAKRFNVQIITVETVNALASTSYGIDSFVPTSLAEATTELFRFYLEYMTEVAKESKNDQEPAAA